MGKKPRLSLRKPPAPVDLVAAERFVQSAAGSPAVQTFERLDAGASSATGVPSTPSVLGPGIASVGRPDAQTSGRLDLPPGVSLGVSPAARAVLARKDGRELRRMTLYLPSDLARRLAVHCAEHDLEMSEVVTAAVRQHLDG
jgi:hypothetical protein